MHSLTLHLSLRTLFLCVRLLSGSDLVVRIQIRILTFSSEFVLLKFIMFWKISIELTRFIYCVTTFYGRIRIRNRIRSRTIWSDPGPTKKVRIRPDPEHCATTSSSHERRFLNLKVEAFVKKLLKLSKGKLYFFFLCNLRNFIVTGIREAHL